MAIPTTYAELKTELANWLKRNDLTNDLAMFIELGEQRINNEDSIIFQRASATITTTANQDYTSLPTGFKEISSLVYDDGSYNPPTKMDLSTLEHNRYPSVTGVPQYYAISNSNFEWDIKADAAYDLTCEYYKNWDIASDSTNYLLTNFSSVYLFCALEAAAIFLRHPGLNVWKSEAALAVDRLRRYSTTREQTPLVVDQALLQSKQSNIFLG